MRLFPSFCVSHTALLSLMIACVLGLTGCGGDSSQTLLSQAQASLKAGDRKTAIIQLKNAIQKDERNAEARFQLARIQIEQGDYAAAEKELRRAREAGFSADKVNPLLARTLINLGEFQRVLTEIPAPLAGSPEESASLVARANAHLGLKQNDEARKSLERALVIAPNDSDTHLAWARMSTLEGKVEDAFQQIDTALKNAPNHLEAWLFKGDLLRASGKTKEAQSAYQAAVKIDPQQSAARLALADIAILENRIPDARAQVEIVLKAFPTSLPGHYTLALIDYQERKYTAGRDHLAKVLKAAPDYLPALLLNGSIEYALGNLQTAETYLNKVVKVAPGNLFALRLLAATQLRLGRADEAASTLLPALKAAPQDVGVRVVAGEIALTKKAFSEASEHFEAAAKVNPDNAAIRTELGLSRLAQGDSRAMVDLQAAARMAGDDGRPDTLILLSQLKNNQFDAALTHISTLEKKAPASPLIWNYRGAAYFGKKDAVRARDSFNQALKLDPSFFPAAINLAKLDLDNNQPDQARKRFESILKIKPQHMSAMLALADLGLRNKDEKTYIGWLEKAATGNPQAVQPKLLIARYLMVKGENSKAVAAAREAVNVEPKNAAALALLGATQYASNDLENASGTYRKLTNLYPKQTGPFVKLAQVQIAMKRPDDARKSLHNALRVKPDLVEAQYMLGSLEVQSANYGKAQKIAKELQGQKLGMSAGYVLEGDTALANKQYPLAISMFERAHKLDPSPATLIRLHQALTAIGREQDGDKHILAWLARKPSDYNVRLYLAERLTTRNQFKSASDHYFYLDRQTPKNLLVLNNLAWTLSELNDKRAISYAEQAYKIKPSNPAVMDTLGWLLVQQGQYQQGIKLLQEALSKAPDAPEIHYHLASAFVKKGDRARAKSEFSRLLANGVYFPHEQDARDQLRQLEQAQK